MAGLLTTWVFNLQPTRFWPTKFLNMAKAMHSIWLFYSVKTGEPGFAANQIVIPHHEEIQNCGPPPTLQPRIYLLVRRLGVVGIPVTTFILPVTPDVQRFSDIALLLQELRAKSGSDVPCLVHRVSERR